SACGTQAAAAVRNFLPLSGAARRWKASRQYVKRLRRARRGRTVGAAAALGPLGRKRNVSGGSSNAANPKNDLQGLKILVIDDSKTIRRTAETLLAKEGCEVFTAVDGFDALSKIAD